MTGARATIDPIKRATLAAALVAASLLPTSGRAAALLSGSFAGTAFNSQVYFGPPYNFDGSRVSGSFVLDLANCHIDPGPGPSTGGCVVTVPTTLRAVVPGSSFSYGQPETLVQVFNTASSQRLSITFGYTAPYGYAFLDLVGGANAFITGSDFASLHPGRIDLARSTLDLHGGRTYRTGVALASVTFDQPTAGVPDAPAWTMLLTGFALTGLALRGKTRTPRRRPQSIISTAS